MAAQMANYTSQRNGADLAQRSVSPRPAEPIAARLLTARQAALYLGVSHWTVRSLSWAGELPSVRLGKRQLRWDRQDLDRFIDQRKHREQD
jgi:excisionase family DNA binding protein